MPLLKQPVTGYPLVVYLAVGEGSISAILVREKENEQCPVYFVGKVLHWAEMRYFEVEKVALAQVTAAWRLQPYFLSYVIVLRTDYPLCSIRGKVQWLENF